ncbi:MAG: hypothetical protein M3680_01185 [Myxococcota bacterium]|nr:hypothetical protein [Myxococcota bacterium]
MRDEAFDQIKLAIYARQRADLVKAGARVGLGLDLDAMTKVHSMCRGPLELQHVFQIIEDAKTAAHGLGFIEFQAGRGECWGGRIVALAVRHEDTITVGVSVLPNAPKNAGDAWPVLRRWFKELKKNRERAELWAQQEAADRVRVKILDAPPSHAPVKDSTADAKLIAALVDDPDDVATRLVLADRWLEREDPRADMLRLDLEARELVERDPDRIAIARQIEAMGKAHRARIAGEVAELVSDFKTGAGFVEGVTMTAGAFKKHGERLFRAQPIRALTVKPWNDEAVATLVKCPHLALVRELILESVAFGHERVVSIAPLAKLKLERLDQLSLNSTITTGPDGEKFFQELVAPRLRSIRVGGGFLGAGALRGLAANTQLCSQLGELDMYMLSSSCQKTRLEAKANEVADKAFGKLALPKLRSLSLHDVWFATDERIARLVKKLPVLEMFDVDDAGAKSVAALTSSRTVTCLPVREPLPAKTLTALLAMPKLRSLYIAGDEWTAAQTKHMAETLLALPKSHPLKEVYFAGDYFQELNQRFPSVRS